jgi:hypothetical protein
MPTTLANYRPYRPRQAAAQRLAALEPAGSGARGRTSGPEAFTVGLEEEMFVVDAATLDCVERLPEAFVHDIGTVLGDSVKREIFASMLEIVTKAHASLVEAGYEFRALRAELGAIAARHGLALLAWARIPSPTGDARRSRPARATKTWRARWDRCRGEFTCAGCTSTSPCPIRRSASA